MSYYDDWLAASRSNDEKLATPPVLARGADAEWLETPQDHEVALLIAPQTGFPTQGTHLARARIPPGAHTGRHRHGEEAIHILAGSGFALIGGRRYDFRTGTTIHVPYLVDHQLVSTSDEAVDYVSAGSLDLDLYVRLGRLEELDEKGTDGARIAANAPAQNGQLDADGRRIVLHFEDAERERARRQSETDGHRRHLHGAIYPLMGGGESGTTERNGFTARSVAMSAIFEEVPQTSSHKHAHTEAMLYVLEGTGYSEIDGRRYDWTAGDALHVPPRMTVHEHFNPTGTRTRTLRVEFAIRYLYEAIYPGYLKIEHRASTMDRATSP